MPSMHHSFIDKYSDLGSPIHRLDVRLKIGLAFVTLILILITPPSFAVLLPIYAVIILILWFISRLPLMHLVKRLGITLPFIVLMALGALFVSGEISPLHRYIFIVAKAILAIAILTLLTSTARFPLLLKGLSWFGMPRIMISIMSFLYRYLFIVIDEAERLSVGRRSRQLSDSRVLAWKSRSWMIGTLFLRSMERSERVYRAMLARGFTGMIRTE